MKKILTLALSLMLALALVSAPALAEVQNYPWNDTSITESSELPDHEGDVLEIIWWNGHGVDAMPNEVSFMDVVEPEIERVTGVKVNYEDSYTNGAGTTFDVRLAMLAGTKDWPHIVNNAQLPAQLIAGDVLWDLTDYIDDYLPNIVRLAPKDDPLFAGAWSHPNLTGDTDRIWGIPTINTNYNLVKERYELDEAAELKFKAAFAKPTNVRQACVAVRDDILKMIYPEAHTMDELEAIYMEKGYFDYDEVFDVPIKSPQDFYDFLYKIDELNLEENGQKVYATYASAGFDTYLLGARLASVLYGWGSARDNFTYWDNVEHKIKFSAYEEEERDLFRQFNKMVREDVISAESLIDDNTTFVSKMNNGQYAVSYAEWAWPDNTIVDGSNGYRYRPLYMDIPVDTERYAQVMDAPTPGAIMIFKDKVNEEDMKKILAWADYHYSEAYNNLRFWGPETAGLFTTNENGQRQFVDEELRDAMLYNDNPDLLAKYNLVNGFTNVNYKVRRLQFGGTYSTGKTVPYMHYDEIERQPAEAREMYKSGLVDNFDFFVGQLGWVWNFSNAVPDIEKAWAARTTWEDTLMKTLAASSDAEFEQLYDDFIAVSKQIGFTDEAMDACTEYFVNTYNAAYMDGLLNYGK